MREKFQVFPTLSMTCAKTQPDDSLPIKERGHSATTGMTPIHNQEGPAPGRVLIPIGYWSAKEANPLSKIHLPAGKFFLRRSPATHHPAGKICYDPPEKQKRQPMGV
ncbi:MAG: hypothetical protein H7837_02550 [Magnetococcus sp. MYC-9]